jgi:hypothetical protein
MPVCHHIGRFFLSISFPLAWTGFLSSSLSLLVTCSHNRHTPPERRYPHIKITLRFRHYLTMTYATQCYYGTSTHRGTFLWLSRVWQFCQWKGQGLLGVCPPPPVVLRHSGRTQVANCRSACNAYRQRALNHTADLTRPVRYPEYDNRNEIKRAGYISGLLIYLYIDGYTSFRVFGAVTAKIVVLRVVAPRSFVGG